MQIVWRIHVSDPLHGGKLQGATQFTELSVLLFNLPALHSTDVPPWFLRNRAHLQPDAE